MDEWVLSPEAQHRIEKTRKANSTEFDLLVMGPEEVRKVAKSMNDESLLKTREHHFHSHSVNSPVASPLCEQHVPFLLTL
ncbi:hypothetical protein [Pseudomonas delhiensis]|uniref:hypothetical protein n=1 Tax=Pseudomonas delhiensis TaxID=366289 RepID=UPI003159F3C0